jgi:hypothetical protein
MADWRAKTEINIHLKKVDVIYSFARLKEQIKDDLDKIVISKNRNY